MKKGDKRVRVNILDKKTGEKIGEKDIYETNKFAGSGGFMMSWADRNKMPRPNSQRQQKLEKERKDAETSKSI